MNKQRRKANRHKLMRMLKRAGAVLLTVAMVWAATTLPERAVARVEATNTVHASDWDELEEQIEKAEDVRTRIILEGEFFYADRTIYIREDQNIELLAELRDEVGALRSDGTEKEKKKPEDMTVTIYRKSEGFFSSMIEVEKGATLHIGDGIAFTDLVVDTGEAEVAGVRQPRRTTNYNANTKINDTGNVIVDMDFFGQTTNAEPEYVDDGADFVLADAPTETIVVDPADDDDENGLTNDDDETAVDGETIIDDEPADEGGVTTYEAPTTNEPLSLNNDKNTVSGAGNDVSIVINTDEEINAEPYPFIDSDKDREFWKFSDDNGRTAASERGYFITNAGTLSITGSTFDDVAFYKGYTDVAGIFIEEGADFFMPDDLEIDTAILLARAKTNGLDGVDAQENDPEEEPEETMQDEPENEGNTASLMTVFDVDEISIKINVIWNDSSNALHKRPTNTGDVSVSLVASSSDNSKSANLSDANTTNENKWVKEDVFTSVSNKDGDGQHISYTISAGDVNGYEASPANGIAITPVSDDEMGKQFEATITYNLRSDKPAVVKSVQNKDGATKKVSTNTSDNTLQLASASDMFTYIIDVKVPENATSIVITDALPSELAYVNKDFSSVITNNNNNDVTVRGTGGASTAVTISGQNVTVTVTDLPATAKDQTISVQFNAKIRDGANIDYDDSKIPNVAVAKVNNNDAYTATSAAVYVRPPVGTAISKKINGGDHLTLSNKRETFTYRIETYVPNYIKDEMEAFIISDTLKTPLQFATNAAGVTANVYRDDGTTVLRAISATETVSGSPAIRISGQTLSVRVPSPEDYVGKKVVVEFQASLKSNATISDTEFPNQTIPNEATWSAYDKSSTVTHTGTSNAVTVKATADSSFTKTVNDSKNYRLGDEDEIVTYKIVATIPSGAKTFSVTDEVPPELQINAAAASVGGQTVANGVLTVNGQTVTANFTDATSYQGKEFLMMVQAQVRSDAELSAEYSIANYASMTVDGVSYRTDDPAVLDAEVLGQSRRGGETGEAGMTRHIITLLVALAALVILGYSRVEY